jgi:hypothetical protein
MTLLLGTLGDVAAELPFFIGAIDDKQSGRNVPLITLAWRRARTLPVNSSTRAQYAAASNRNGRK